MADTATSITDATTVSIGEAWSLEANDSGITKQPMSVIYLGMAYTAIMVLSLPGNMLTVMACVKFKELRSPAHLLIINQSVGDLISAVMTIIYLIPYFLPMEESKYHCLFNQTGIFTGITTSVLNLMAISIDRFLSVVFTFQYFTWVTTRRVNIGICLLWGITFSIFLMPVMGWNTWRRGFPCQSMYVLDPKFFNIFFNFPVLIALFLTAAGNIVIGIIAVSKSKKVGDIEDKTKELKAKTQLKVTKMLLRVVGTFYVCWMPYIFMNSLMRYPPKIWRENGVPDIARFLFSLAQSFLMFSAVINPFIYAQKDKDFRRAYCKILGIKQAVDQHTKSSWTESEATGQTADQS